MQMWINNGNKDNVIKKLYNEIISSFVILDLSNICYYIEHCGSCVNVIPQNDIKSYSMNRFHLTQIM
jgi:hypothetical protein